MGFVLALIIVTAPALLPQEPSAPTADNRPATASIVERSLSDLISGYPELKDLQPARTQDDLPNLLERIGQRVRLLFDGFPNTSSTEHVKMESLDRLGAVRASRTMQFKYLMLANPEGQGLKVAEYKTDSRDREVDLLKVKNAGFLTSGYASTPLFFHPAFSTGAAFRYLGRDGKDGTLVIAFAQIPQAARLAGTFYGSYGPFGANFWLWLLKTPSTLRRDVAEHGEGRFLESDPQRNSEGFLAPRLT